MANQHAKRDKAAPVRTVATRTLSPRAACAKNCAPPHSSVTSARAPVPSPPEKLPARFTC
eukprot:scaffold135523_cov217-Phaeocystis_antarctica.AAC.1